MEGNDELSLCVRLKREKTIYFFTCSQIDHIDLLKRKLLPFHKGVDTPDIRLYLGTRVI